MNGSVSILSDRDEKRSALFFHLSLSLSGVPLHGR